MGDTKMARHNWWWDKLTRQQKEVFKLRQFQQYSREERDGDDVIVIIFHRDYWTGVESIKEKIRVTPDGKIARLPANDEYESDLYWKKIKEGNV
jgi:hypothetical protein